jgi:hypothetical protein
MAIDDVALGHVVDTPERIQDLVARHHLDGSGCQQIEQALLESGQVQLRCPGPDLAVHVVEMKKPSREYPVAIGLGATVALVIFALGAIPIAAILPNEKISLQSGVFDTFSAVIVDVWHINWLVPIKPGHSSLALAQSR